MTVKRKPISKPAGQRNLLTAATACLAMGNLIAPAFIQPAKAQQSEQLEGIIVSGGLTPVAADSYARSYTVVTGEEIEQRGIKFVGDALRQIPGLHVTRSGGPGGTTEVRLRGAESNHVLVLIDGIETADSSSGFEFADMTAENIERIEVLRGPQSALYGANATAGVINIITKRGIRNGSRVSATVEGGTSPSKALSALFQAGSDWMDASLSISRRDDEGWDTSDKGGEKDGLENTTVNAKINADLTSNLAVRGVARFTSRTTEFDDGNFGCGTPACYSVDADNFTKGHDKLFGFWADYKMLDGALVHAPSITFSADDNEITQPAFGDPSTNKASTLKAGYKLAYTFGPQDQSTLVGAVEYKQERFDSSFAAEEQTRDQMGYVLDFRSQVTDRIFIQAGGRFDDNELFDDAVTWSTSASYLLKETGSRFHASIGKGVTNPTFFEQFGTIFGTFIGNPGLTPEENLAWDAGIEQTLFSGALVVDVTYFKAKLTDEIVDQFLITGEITPANLDGESDRHGIEVAATIQPMPDLMVTAVYTYLQATEPDGSPEVRRPEHAGGVKIAYSFLQGRARVGTDVTYNGKNFQRDFSSPTFLSPKIEVDDYVVVDFNASYQLTDNWQIYGILNNAFAEDYQELLSYGAQPQTGYIGLKAKF